MAVRSAAITILRGLCFSFTSNLQTGDDACCVYLHGAGPGVLGNTRLSSNHIGLGLAPGGYSYWELADDVDFVHGRMPAQGAYHWYLGCYCYGISGSGPYTRRPQTATPTSRPASSTRQGQRRHRSISGKGWEAGIDRVSSGVGNDRGRISAWYVRQWTAATKANTSLSCPVVTCLQKWHPFSAERLLLNRRFSRTFVVDPPGNIAKRDCRGSFHAIQCF